MARLIVCDINPVLGTNVREAGIPRGLARSYTVTQMFLLVLGLITAVEPIISDPYLDTSSFPRISGSERR